MGLPSKPLLSASQALLLGGFACYVVSTLLLVSGTLGRRLSRGSGFLNTASWGGWAMTLGALLHGGGILTRWLGTGYWPTSNMNEFIGFMAFSTVLAFLIVHRMYRMDGLGAVLAPVFTFLMAYSYVFPTEAAPLIPALQSYWMPLHVSLAALGEGFFAVAFGAAFLYLLRARGLELAQPRAEVAAAADRPAISVSAAAAGGQVLAGGAAHRPAKAGVRRQEVRATREQTWGGRLLEVVFYLILVMAGFTVLALAFRYSGFEWRFFDTVYHLPPIIGPAGSQVGEHGRLFGVIPLPAVVAPFGWHGKHLNTLLYSLAVGGVLYWTIRAFIARGPIADALARRVGGDLELLDEISYRAVAIGYPIFTLGGLIFAMIWANEAWGSYWSWDPKETWALIAWLVYSAYLHFRITRGWEGRRSAWLAVVGFGVILFTLVGVNLLIVGLHSYAGGD